MKEGQINTTKGKAICWHCSRLHRQCLYIHLTPMYKKRGRHRLPKRILVPSLIPFP
ncbi:HEL297Cp [Eremothecium sinecaudum]|uniref:HEL297Cp n=1 Tax=Eremothecium sinecaudum TaxID=45286 RepID=A0A0X8HT43_9SACH|nr:HEL297Cp [Eremothecium sinecaudum]AMD20984.1 HEL297Cp [Eremothecium sinecaudum]